MRENNKYLDKTYVYEYNEIGNITSVKEYSYTTGTVSGGYSSKALVYGDASNPDRLTRYGYKDISYNSNGYPTRYGDMILVWDRGKLVKMYEDVDDNSYNSKETYEFKYNAYGQRISKIYDYDPGPDYSGNFLIGYEITYTYDNSGRLIREDREEYYTESASVTYETVYLYDQSDILGFTLKRGNVDFGTYYFNKNIHGDVTEIYNSTGSAVVKYAYDAFGNCTVLHCSDSLADKFNPIRYRSYYYDIDTKLYYLNARYYNPEWHRFISPDSTEYLDPETPNGLNLYIYCNNDPVNYADPSGHLAFCLAACLVIGAVGLIGGGTYAGFKSSQAGNKGWGLVSDIAFGAVIGGIVGFAAGTIIGASVSALVTGSFLSSVQAVKAGAILTYQMFRAGGIAAGAYMMLDNLSNAFNSPLHVFWSGGDIAKNQAVSYANQNGGITLEMTRLGKYLETLPYNPQLWGYASQNFANQVSNNGIVRAILYYPGMRLDAIWFTEKEILIKKMVEIIIGSLN